MADFRKLWLVLPRAIRNFPADLATLIGLVVLMGLTLLSGVRGTPVQILIGLPFVLFAPGYVLVGALFPERGGERVPYDSETDRFFSYFRRGVDVYERIILSFWFSIAIVPLLSLGLNFTPWGIRLVPVVLTIAGVTVVGAVVAAVRRWDLPPEQRFRVPYREWWETGYDEFVRPSSRIDLVMNVVLVLSLLLAVGSASYAVVVPQNDQQFTEFYVLAENETGGLNADDYPTEFELDQSEQVIIGISNHEGRPTNYSVVVQLQRVEFQNNSTRVTETQRLDRFDSYVRPNSTLARPHTISPTMTGEELRLQYLLYRGSVPSNPTAANAYRRAHFWINVSSPEEQG
jgi:uncharacterized membrane protein